MCVRQVVGEEEKQRVVPPQQHGVLDGVLSCHVMSCHGCVEKSQTDPDPIHPSPIPLSPALCRSPLPTSLS